MISRDFLDRIEVFRIMDDQQLAAVGACCREVDFSCGDRLFAEGSEANHLWFLIDGRIDLRFELPARETSGEHTVSSLSVDEPDSPAQAVGWSCFVEPYKMRLSAYCVSPDCKTIRIKKKDLLQLFQKDPGMGYFFMSYLITVVGRRFHHFQDYVAEHLGKNLMSGW